MERRFERALDGNTLVVETTNYTNKGWIATNVASGRIKGIPQVKLCE